VRGCDDGNNKLGPGVAGNIGEKESVRVRRESKHNLPRLPGVPLAACVSRASNMGGSFGRVDSAVSSGFDPNML
jgi:hypothetical protein